MSETIPGHDVMHFMLESGQNFTKESLRDAVIAHFGAEARFHTCSAEDMTAEQLITLLEAKGKFVPAEGGFTTHEEKICRH